MFNFVFWSIPILCAESKKRKILQLRFGTGLYDGLYCRTTFLMAEDPVLRVFFGPTPVTIHNDGDVL